ncbi:MAG: hypothetical protein E7602_08480 [Ruminococcaceae bacterium]|nr:hypothetical protein [Oscillospiraceae bacterium]
MDKTMSKEETLNQLYALRAGLSLVDKEYDKVKESKLSEENLVKETNNKKEVLENKNNELFYNSEIIKSSSEDKKCSYERELKFYNDAAGVTSAAKARVDKIKPFVNANMLLFISAIVVFGIMLILNFGTDIVKDGSILHILLCISGPVAAVSGIIFFPLTYVYKGKMAEYIKLNEKLKKIPKPSEPRSDEINYLDNAKYISNQEKISENKKLMEGLNHQLAEMKKSTHEKIVLVSKYAMEIYNSVVDEFSKSLPNLDCRDYKHVDLIIYLLETGRADEMKEALQQTDVYVSTERIVQAINNATETISLSINKNFSRLENAIIKNTYELGNKIDRLTYNVNAMSDRQSALISELNKNVEKTNSAIKMQNALLEKSNVSSAEMASNVERMRMYADDAYIKNSNI